jgi:dUTP pyrophosphatase
MAEDPMKELQDALGSIFKSFGEIENKIKLIKMNDDAVIPEYKHKGDSGFDLSTCEDFELKKGEFRMVHTGLKVASLPPMIELQVRSRSGLAAKSGVFVLNSPGTVDNSYRGEICVILMNVGEPISFKKGDRIAQCIPAAVGMNEIAMVAGDETVKSDRGENGFGSTGINNNVKQNEAGVK